MSAFSPAFADQVPYVRTLRVVIAATARKDSMEMHARLRDVWITMSAHVHRAAGMRFAATRWAVSGANVNRAFQAIR